MMKYPSVSDLSLQGEEWEYVDGFGKRYMISNFGRVLSTEKFVNNHTGKIHKPNRILSQHSDSKVYKRTYLDMGDGKTRFIPVHRLVAIAFVPNPLSKPQVNHIDGNKQNNNVENLEWVTNQENQIHAVKNGLNDHSKYESGRPKHPVLQINKDTDEIIAEYESITEAAKAVGCKTSSNIGGCCRNVYGRKTMCGYKWKFKEEVV